MLSRAVKSTKLAIATLGNDAGVIGGAWLVKKAQIRSEDDISCEV